MKSQIILIQFFAFIFLLSCQYKDPLGYNEIQFSDPIVAVTDSLISMEKLLDKFSEKGSHNFYISNWGFLKVNNISVGNWDKIKGDSSLIVNIKELKPLNSNEKLRLIYLLSYLTRNQILGVGFNNNFNKYFFDYMDSIPQEHTYRVIIINNNIPKRFNKNYKIIDKKGSLILAGPDYSEHYKKYKRN